MIGAWLLSTVAALIAPGDSGMGPFPIRPHDIVTAAGERGLDRIATDGVRVSSAPALGGKGWVVTVRRTADRRAEGTVTVLRGHPASGWRVTGRRAVALSHARWIRMATAIDQALAGGTTGPEPGADLPICTDGPGYRTEREQDGEARWLVGFCGPAHPNVRIVAAIKAAVGEP